MRAILAVLSLALVAGSVAAEPNVERVAVQEPVSRLFETRHLEGAEAGAVLRYDHARASEPALGIGPDFDQTIAVETGQGRAERFTLNADEAPRTYPVSEGVPGNPVLVVFLENVLRATATATGGSRFYLQNRMREALADRLESAGPNAPITMRPFAGDAEAARLGAFEGLTMTFALSPDAPGMFTELAAVAGPEDAPVYREEIRLETDN